jgi:hypothetical protein
MLREVGKRDEEVLRKFLDEHAKQMPNMMYRYAIEKNITKTGLNRFLSKYFQGGGWNSNQSRKMKFAFSCFLVCSFNFSNECYYYFFDLFRIRNFLGFSFIFPPST